MLNMVVSSGKSFNWTDIFSFELQCYIGKEKESLKVNQAPKFYISAFILDGICAQHAFLGMY